MAPVLAATTDDKVVVGAFIALFSVAGLVVFFQGFTALGRKRLIEDTPTSTIRAMAPGQVEIAGLPVEWKPLTAPFSLKPCVYYAVRVDEENEREVKDKDGRTHTERYWVTLHSADTSRIPFFLDDGTAKVMVKPEGAEIIMTDHYRTSSHGSRGAPSHIQAYLSKNGVSSWKPLDLVETSFRFGLPIYALGNCAKGTIAKDPPAGSLEETCLLKGAQGETFLLSSKGQKALVGSLGWKAFFGIFGGILLLAAAVWVWTVFGRVFERGY